MKKKINKGVLNDKKKAIKKKFKVAFWKEYIYLLKAMAWVCVNEESGEFICEAKTLKEIEEILIKEGK